MTIIRHSIRFAVSALVLLVVGWIVPGFNLAGFWSAFVAAVIIAVIGWGIEALMGPRVSPYSRGFIGFAVSALVIYMTQFFIAGFRVTLIGALLAALVIGLVDWFVPAKPRFAATEEVGNRAD
jgi:putative membrane protein